MVLPLVSNTLGSRRSRRGRPGPNLHETLLNTDTIETTDQDQRSAWLSTRRKPNPKRPGSRTDIHWFRFGNLILYEVLKLLEQVALKSKVMLAGVLARWLKSAPRDSTGVMRTLGRLFAASSRRWHLGTLFTPSFSSSPRILAVRKTGSSLFKHQLHPLSRPICLHLQHSITWMKSR